MDEMSARKGEEKRTRNSEGVRAKFSPPPRVSPHFSFSFWNPTKEPTRDQGGRGRVKGFERTNEPTEEEEEKSGGGS